MVFFALVIFLLGTEYNLSKFVAGNPNPRKTIPEHAIDVIIVK